MRRYVIAAALAALLIATALAPGATGRGKAAPRDEPAMIRDILADDAIWGEDFTALLATLKDWGEAGQREIEVFGNEAGEPEAAAAPSPSEEAAAKARARLLNSLLEQGTTKFKAEFEARLKEGGDGGQREKWSADAAIKEVSPAVYPSRDDEAPRVMMLLRSEAAGGTQYLQPGLTISTVEGRRGEPEQVSYRRIDSDDERRPVVLKLHHYAGGAVKFAESNVTPPGTVERVILDVRKISRTIF